MENQNTNEDEQQNEISEEKINYFKNSFQNAQQLAEFADSKAGTLLTIHAGLLTIVTGATFINDIREKITTYIDFGLIITIFGLLVISTYYSLNVIFPREAHKKDSLFFYKKIAEYENELVYFNEVKNSDSTKIAKAYANQSYEVSRIASKKMDSIRKSLYFLIAYFFMLIIGSLIIFYW